MNVKQSGKMIKIYFQIQLTYTVKKTSILLKHKERLFPAKTKLSKHSFSKYLGFAVEYQCLQNIFLQPLKVLVNDSESSTDLETDLVTFLYDGKKDGFSS